MSVDSQYHASMSAFRRRSAILLPGFLKPVSSRLGDEEREYLQKKGALLIPDPPVRDSLCRAFMEFVYPCSPILDVSDFFTKMNRGDASLGRVSLLVFQAVMFAGAAHVPMEDLERAGYRSRREARLHLYNKVRVRVVSFA